MSDMLNKVVNDPNDVRADAKGGRLTPAQSDTFLDYMNDYTVLGSQVRTLRIQGESAEITRMAVGQRLTRLATEAVDDGVNVGAAFGKISVTTSKFRLDWEFSTEALEDGREGEALEDHIARLMAQQVANDLEDYAVNSDPKKTDDPSLSGFHGWSVLGSRLGHVFDAGGSTLDRNVFSKMIKALPREAKNNRGALKFFASANALQDFIDSEYELRMSIGDIGMDQSDQISGPLGVTGPRVFGQTVQEVPVFRDDKVGTYSGAGASAKDHSEVWLTNPKNLIWAIQRDIKIYREFKTKADTTEYTLYTRVGTAIEDGNAFVVAKNVKTN